MADSGGNDQRDPEAVRAAARDIEAHLHRCRYLVILPLVMGLLGTGAAWLGGASDGVVAAAAGLTTAVTVVFGVVAAIDLSRLSCPVCRSPYFPSLLRRGEQRLDRETCWSCGRPLQRMLVDGE